MMARPGREFAIAHGPQLAAERLLGDGQAELLPDRLCQIDQTPAHHAVDGRDWAAVHDAGQRTPLVGVELRGRTWRLAVEEAVGPERVEAQHPVPHDLQCDATDPGRI